VLNSFQITAGFSSIFAQNLRAIALVVFKLLNNQNSPNQKYKWVYNVV
jgi:hypothetical protein